MLGGRLSVAGAALVAGRAMAHLAVAPRACAGAFALTIARAAGVGGAAAGVPAPHRGYASTTRRRRKELKREHAAELRALLQFATLYDPLRTAKLELAHTLDRLGWAFRANEMISDGVTVDFSMAEQFCAFAMVDAAHVVPGGHPEASAVPAVPPLPRGPDGALLLPTADAYPYAPRPWDNPVLGHYLDRATAAHVSLVESKGWKLVVVPLPLWQAARAAPRNQHYARRDLLLQLTLPRVPFEQRPPTPGGERGAAGGGRGAGGTQAAAARQAKLAAAKRASDAAAAATGEIKQRAAAKRRDRAARKAARSGPAADAPPAAAAGSDD